MTGASPYRQALDELSRVFDRLDEAPVESAVEEIANARRIVLFGAGREGLQMRGFAMRLHHLGLNASVVGDMTTPPVGPEDVFIASCGPGTLGTVLALLDVAKSAGARTIVVTAQPQGEAPRRADLMVPIPAQTMADDVGQLGAPRPPCCRWARCSRGPSSSCSKR